MLQHRPRPTCDSAARARYFPRQVILPADLSQDQSHELDRFRRHNRLFHGWGVVCGLKVERVEESETQDSLRNKYGIDPAGVDPTRAAWVVVLPGFALTPTGDEVVVPDPVFVAVAMERPDQTLVVAPTGCASVADRPLSRAEGDWALVIEAWEEQTGAVRAANSRCGDDPAHLEFGRVRDTVAFRLIRVDPPPLPEAYPGSPPDKVTPVLRGAAKRCGVRIGTVTFDNAGKMTAATDAHFEALRKEVEPKT